MTVGNPAVNADSVKNKVQTFVDQYNSTIDFIQSKLTEQPVKDPQTSTDLAQGHLFNDQGLNSILQSLRGSIGTIFNTGNDSSTSSPSSASRPARRPAPARSPRTRSPASCRSTRRS